MADTPPHIETTIVRKSHVEIVGSPESGIPMETKSISDVKSDSRVKKIADFDLVFRYIGEAGLYQIIIYVLLGLPSYFSGYQNIAMTFLAPDQEHWCAVDRLLEFPHKQQKYVGE